MLHDVDKQIADDWQAFRKARRAPVTHTVVKIIRIEADKLGITVEQALTMCIANSWLSIKASWPKAVEEANEIRVAEAKLRNADKTDVECTDDLRIVDPSRVVEIKGKLAELAQRLKVGT